MVSGLAIDTEKIFLSLDLAVVASLNEVVCSDRCGPFGSSRSSTGHVDGASLCGILIQSNHRLLGPASAS